MAITNINQRYVGERWINPDTGREHIISRCYSDSDCLNEETGEAYVWVEFGTSALTYIYDELTSRGWVQGWAFTTLSMTTYTPPADSK